MFPARRFSWLTSVVGPLCVIAACSPSSSSNAAGNLPLSGIDLTGWYKSTSSGTIGEITFLPGSAYTLTRSDCVLSSTGQPSVIDATTTLPIVASGVDVASVLDDAGEDAGDGPGQADDLQAGVDPSAVEYCVESGTYVVDAVAGTLVLKNAATGASTSMRLTAAGSSASSKVALNGATLKIEGTGLGGEAGTSLTGPGSALTLDCESLISGVNLGLQQFAPVAPPNPKSGWPGCSSAQKVNAMGQPVYLDASGDQTTTATGNKGKPNKPLMEGWQHVQNASGQFYITSYGCGQPFSVSSEYGGMSINGYHDPEDNCCPAGRAAVGGKYTGCSADIASPHYACPSAAQTATTETPARQCEEAVKWFVTGQTPSGYQFGDLLCLTGPAIPHAGGALPPRSVVVMVLDDGPGCSVEKRTGGWVLDASYPVGTYLLNKNQSSGVGNTELAVQAIRAQAGTTLGPIGSCGGLTLNIPDGGYAPDGSFATPDASFPSDLSCIGTAAGCTTDLQCPAGQQCLPDVPDGGQLAMGGSGTCQGKQAGLTCANDLACNPGGFGGGLICSGASGTTKGTCIPGCHAGWQCPGAKVCLSGACQ